MAYLIGRPATAQAGITDQLLAGMTPAQKQHFEAEIGLVVANGCYDLLEQLGLSHRQIAKVAKSGSMDAVVNRKGRAPMANRGKKKRRYKCWTCGEPMRAKAAVCGTCRKTRPRAVKAQLATLEKSFGHKVRPVRIPAPVVPARPRAATAADVRRDIFIAKARAEYRPDLREAYWREAHPEFYQRGGGAA